MLKSFILFWEPQPWISLSMEKIWTSLLQLFLNIIMREKYGLAIQFWIAKDTCNSTYLYVMSVNKQIARIAKLQFTVYMMRFIVIQLQLNQNNSFSTIMQFHYNYTHDVMLTSLIVINLLKSNMWHYKKFGHNFFFEILISIIHYDCWWWSKIVTHGTIKNWHMEY